MNIENTILSHLVYNEQFCRKTLPFLTPEYFTGSDQVIFQIIKDYTEKYNSAPTREALFVELNNKEDLNQNVYQEALETVGNLQTEHTNEDWLLDQTEKFCQDKAVYNAIMQSIRILEGKENLTKEALPKVLQDALAVSFDNNIGHDYIIDCEDRYNFYHRTEERMPFDIDMLNQITKGGVPKKTLNIILAGTNVGKSLIMCHMAANNLLQGKNVLYITLEMAEERIAERIDANLMDTPVDQLQYLSAEMYANKIKRIMSKTAGKLIIKEYPPGSAHAGHFRHLINELRLKKNFFPDVIYLDYLNLCASSRVKMGNSVNSYQLIKSVAEEIRGLGVEFGLPMWSATQTNRSGYADSDFDLDSTSESFGLPMTADLMLGVISTEELAAAGQFMVKQLKNRYAGKNSIKKFLVGVDYERMRLYNVEDGAQAGVPQQDASVFDKSQFGTQMTNNKMDKWKGLIV